MPGIVLTNGRIYTLDEDFNRVCTVVIKKSKIIRVTNEFERTADKNSLFIDLKGKTVIPAFCDSHIHLLLYIQSLSQVDLSAAKSLRTVLDLIQNRAKKSNPGEWILGKGWNINQWSTLEFPDKKSLDKISPLNPVALSSKDEHLLWVNSLALKLAGIDSKFSDPEGGMIERYISFDEPTGILKEQAVSLIYKILDKPNARDFRKSFCGAAENAYRLGITSVHNFDGGTIHCLLESMAKEGNLPLRILDFFRDDQLDYCISSGISSGEGNEFLKIGGIKFFADGTLGSRTALMFEPYEKTDNDFGIEVTSVRKLESEVTRANANGLNVAIHAIGDKGVHNALDAIEHSTKKNRKRYPNRIEHIQLVRPSDLERFKNLGVIASVQPIHAVCDRDAALKHWGKRAINSYPLSSFLKNKIPTIFGSDCPIENLDPLRGISAAITRKKNKKDKTSFLVKEKIGIKEAVLGLTKWPAMASGEGSIKGTIQRGKLADMIVLSDDIFEVPPQELPNIEILATIFDGKIVYGQENL